VNNIKVFLKFPVVVSIPLKYADIDLWLVEIYTLKPVFVLKFVQLVTVFIFTDSFLTVFTSKYVSEIDHHFMF